MTGEPAFLGLRWPPQPSLRAALAVAAAGLALLLLLDWAVPAPRSAPPAPAPGAEAGLAQLQADLESRLADILGRVQGAGRVRVQVALAAGPEREFAVDQTRNRSDTEEQDRNGTTRRVIQTDEQGRVVAVNAPGGQEALVRRVRGPEIRGVLVVAEGAADPAVRAALTRAAQAALGVPLHLVTVVPGGPQGGGEGR